MSEQAKEMLKNISKELSRLSNSNLELLEENIHERASIEKINVNITKITFVVEQLRAELESLESR